MTARIRGCKEGFHKPAKEKLNDTQKTLIRVLLPRKYLIIADFAAEATTKLRDRDITQYDEPMSLNAFTPVSAYLQI